MAERDIWEVANQLEGYVDEATPEPLARFLLREGSAARDLASKIVKLRKALEFYADVSKYPAPLTGGMGDLWEDCGSIAREALIDAGL